MQFSDFVVWEQVPRLVQIVLISSILIIVFNFGIRHLRIRLLKRARTKKQRNNIEVFSRVATYFFFIMIVLFSIFSYGGAWTGLGLGVGFFTAALGWALQKPITGIAAWIMVIVSKPFVIGDRVVIGDVRGDVDDITLTHVHLIEIGGMIDSEERSGRTIMLPNSILFEKTVVNYTQDNDFVLSEVVTSVTYESNLDKALRIVLKAAMTKTKKYRDQEILKPYVRCFFGASCVEVHVRYYVPSQEIQEVASNITKEIYDKIAKERSVEIAYPHLEVIHRKKKR